MKRAAPAIAAVVAIGAALTVAVLRTSAPSPQQQAETATTIEQQHKQEKEGETQWQPKSESNLPKAPLPALGGTAPASSSSAPARTVSRSQTTTPRSPVNSAPAVLILTTRDGNSLPSEGPYHDTMLPGMAPEEERWTQTNHGANVTSQPGAVIMSTANIQTRTLSARAAASNTPTSSTDDAPAEPIVAPAIPASSTADPCLTVATAYQSQCATAIRWRLDIGKRFGSVMERRHRWMTAAQVDDWLRNGCNPSPCDASGTGRIQPADYFGAQGYDSPLGTCHSSTPTQRRYGFTCSNKDAAMGCAAPGAISTRGSLGGTLGDDGKVHGWVMYPGAGMFKGTIADVECANGCSVEFDHPCSLPDLNVQPFWWHGKDGGQFATWWFGGNVGKETAW